MKLRAKLLAKILQYASPSHVFIYQLGDFLLQSLLSCEKSPTEALRSLISSSNLPTEASFSSTSLVFVLGSF